MTPGPLPPLSHLGATLLRHTVGTGLRYALYQLGMPLPEAPPVRIVRLRLYLDGGKLGRWLGEAPGGMEVMAALLDPGGAGAMPRMGGGAGRMAVAAALHRTRLRLVRQPAARLPAMRPPVPDEEPWQSFQREMSRLLRVASDALLAELLASLDRRDRRARDEAVPPAMSRSAADLLAGRQVPLERFGVLDPLAPTWAARPKLAEQVRRELVGGPALPAHPLRGSFRETYRAALTRLAPLLAAHASAAVRRGHIEKEGDAYFVPLDLQEDLAGPSHPHWVAQAVQDNRAERESLLTAPGPAELLYTGLELEETGGEAAWDRTPLSPLP